MNQDNDIDRGPLAGWVIAIAHGQTFLGKPSEVLRLAPVYSLIAALAPTPQGLATMRQVSPVLTYPTIQSLLLPENAIMIPIGELDNAERRELAKGVQACDDLMRQMRAQASGLIVPPAGARVREPEKR